MAESRIMLIPRLPEDFALDVLFRGPDGFIVQASEAEIARLQQGDARGPIAVAELYRDGNEYARAMSNLTKEEAIAALAAARTFAVAALSPSERSQFGIA